MSITFSVVGVAAERHWTEPCGCNPLRDECAQCGGRGVVELADTVAPAFNVSNTNGGRILRALGIEVEPGGEIAADAVPELLLAVYSRCEAVYEYRGCMADLFRSAIKNKTGICWG